MNYKGRLTDTIRHNERREGREDNVSDYEKGDRIMLTEDVQGHEKGSEGVYIEDMWFDSHVIMVDGEELHGVSEKQFIRI
jgi:hypothetical protein